MILEGGSHETGQLLRTQYYNTNRNSWRGSRRITYVGSQQGSWARMSGILIIIRDEFRVFVHACLVPNSDREDRCTPGQGKCSLWKKCSELVGTQSSDVQRNTLEDTGYQMCFSRFVTGWHRPKTPVHFGIR